MHAVVPFCPTLLMRYDKSFNGLADLNHFVGGVTTIQQHRGDIVRFGKMLHQCGLVAATDGNLSVRMEDGNVLCTPTLMSKGMMEPEDLVVVDANGQKVSGRREVSSELA